jgi:hypothetical protein
VVIVNTGCPQGECSQVSGDYFYEYTLLKKPADWLGGGYVFSRGKVLGCGFAQLTTFGICLFAKVETHNPDCVRIGRKKRSVGP